MSDLFPLDNLPDDILVDVMARQPLEDLVRLGHVSARWRNLSGVALGRITRLNVMIGTRSIGVATDFYAPRHIEQVQLDRTAQERAQLLGLPWIDPQASLTFVTFGQDQLLWLTASMPNIRELTIAQQCGDMAVTDAVGQLTSMVDHWSLSLTSLAIHSVCEGITPDHGRRLFASINGLTRLGDLYLKLAGDWHDVLDLPVLARIRRFVFYSGGDPVDCLLPTLRRYASVNASLEQIHLGNHGYPYVPDFLDLDQSVTTKMTGLVKLDFSDPHEDNLPVICAKFTSLTYLYLQVEQYTKTELVAALVHLPQLHYLRLNLLEAENLWSIEAEADQRQNYAIQMSEGPQLTAIQVLAITMGTSANHQYFARMFHWRYVFPSLRAIEVIELGRMDCDRCGIEEGSELRRPRHCTRQLLLPFKDCPQLRKLAYSVEEWSLDDL